METQELLEQSSACIGYSIIELNHNNLNISELYLHAAGTLLNLASLKLEHQIQIEGKENNERNP